MAEAVIKEELARETVIQNYDKQCLSCMATTKDLKNVNEKFNKSITLTLLEALVEVSMFDFTANDDIPQQLCSQCEYELRIAYEFKYKIENSDLVYRNQLNSVFIPTSDDMLSVYPKIELKEESEFMEKSTDLITTSIGNELDRETNRGDSNIPLDKKICKNVIKNEPLESDNKLLVPEIKSKLRNKKPIKYKIETDLDEDIFSSEENSNDEDYLTNSRTEKEEDNLSMTSTDNNLDDGDEFMDPIGEIESNENVNKIAAENEIPKTFSCTLCPSKFLFQTSLNKHMKKHKPHNKDRECHICHKVFTSNKYTAEHIKRNHIDADKFSCEQCGKRCKNAQILEIHIKSHELEKENRCSHCPQQFEDPVLLRQHVMKEHFPFECSICSKRFNIKSSWLSHERNHKKQKPFQCGQCPKKYRNADMLRIHRHCVHQTIRYNCILCIQKFSAKRFLQNHVKVNHPEADSKFIRSGQAPFPHVCEYCTRRFKELDEYDDHDCVPILKHDCDKCSKKFPLQSLLKLHIRNDHENLSVKCPSCNKVFKKKKLEKHMLTHAPGYVEKKTCPQCYKDFKVKNYERHMLTHQPGYKPLDPVGTSKECPHCKRVFNREVNYQKHLESHNKSTDSSSEMKQ